MLMYKRIPFYNKGKYKQKIADYVKNIEINPKFAFSIAYNNRGLFLYNKNRMDRSDRAISYYLQSPPPDHKNRNNRIISSSDENKAIEINRKNADAYYNLGLAHFERGFNIRSRLVAAPEWGSEEDIKLKLEMDYNNDLAISDFSKSIEINSKNADAYYNRAISYFYKKEYDKAWNDVYKYQNLGHEVDLGFLKMLQEASGK